jgi:ATP-dependent DNA helicase DinG
MDLQSAVREAFAPGGVLSAAAEQFQPREGQTQMARAVARTIEEGGVLVVEAGTGVGKTFSYLTPSLLSGEQVLISTATKTLQDQLYGRDLPRLAQALGIPVRMALLKGRSSYLCLHRLEQARWDDRLNDSGAAMTLAGIEIWAARTSSGDLAEMPDLDERSAVIPLVTSTRENCLGSECPKFRGCYVNAARREALAADVVVINHHLFFADLVVRESGVAELLPTVRVVIFDEAHQLNETGVQFLGTQLSTGQLLDFARDMLTAGWLLARGLADWQGLARLVERAVQELRLCVGQAGPAESRLRWTESSPEGLEDACWQSALFVLSQAISQCVATLDALSETAPDFVRLCERAEALLDRVHLFSIPCETGAVRWMDSAAQTRMMQSPLDIAETVKTRMLKQGDVELVRRAWIFTSATLGADKDLRWFTEPCGLTKATTLKVESPFDYARQSSLYVPRHLVRPSDPGHSAQVALFAANAARLLGGRTLLLTTSLRALRAIGEALRTAFSGTAMEILVQGKLPKRVLVERFRQPGPSGAILVASASFWEGVDVPGDALQLVIIDKVPFPPPNDPVGEARSRRLEEAGRSAFRDYSLPEAAIALKQGAGRLIRHETDRGILVVCDTRLITMGYGRRLLAALPPMRRLQTDDEFQDALEDLTRISTMDPRPP